MGHRDGKARQDVHLGIDGQGVPEAPSSSGSEAVKGRDSDNRCMLCGCPIEGWTAVLWHDRCRKRWEEARLRKRVTGIVFDWLRWRR